MSRLRTAQELFRRTRMPGDLVFAVAFMLLSFFLLSQLPTQVVWAEKTKLVAQPAFWPTLSVFGMVVFSVLHWLGSVSSPRIPGRWREVLFWCRAVEFGGWFLAYVLILPVIGYLASSLVFATALTVRLGYRSWRAIGAAALLAVVTVVLFRAVLKVKVPAGQVYEYLPDGLRSIAQIYL